MQRITASQVPFHDGMDAGEKEAYLRYGTYTSAIKEA